MTVAKYSAQLQELMRYFLMQSYPARALDRRLQVDSARDPREGLRVLMSLRVDFEPMG